MSRVRFRDETGTLFVDVEGNLDDAAVQNALRGVKEESALCIVSNFEA
ncbi:MAG: hypothetical protein ACLSD6_08860 [Clostridium sp.]